MGSAVIHSKDEEDAVTRDVGDSQAKGPGLKDNQGRQSDLVDRRSGAFDRAAPKPAHPNRQHITAHEAAKHGADVRAETEPSDQGLPEGLQRERKSPINPHGGRGDVPSHVPAWKPGGEG